MVKLSVNINKIATLRNARGGNVPNVLKVALDIEDYGADGITVHPRPDERHIRWTDVYDLSREIRSEFNIEGYPSSEFIDKVCKIKPHQVTLVPDPPDALTSNAGWDTVRHAEFLSHVISQFKREGIRVSVFLDPFPDRVSSAVLCGADRIELYTEAYAQGFLSANQKAIEPYLLTAEEAAVHGLGVNAGHDLNLSNLSFFCRNIKSLLEVSIGHALVCDALYYGLKNTVAMYKERVSPIE
jgi:pyridoxine 5-phosphate synthase